MGREPTAPRVLITGMGVRNSIASNVPEFLRGLREGRHGFKVSDRSPSDDAPPVAAPLLDPSWSAAFEELPAEMSARASRARKVLRHAPLASRVAACVALEAYREARLEELLERDAVGVVVAGNNIHQGYILEGFRGYLERPEYVNPRYAFCFMDTHTVGALSEIFDLRGAGFTVGAASASGNVALSQAWQMVRTGQAEVCLCVGALADYTGFEWRALKNLGALSSGHVGVPPEATSRPFDARHSGFVYGQGSGCVVLENAEHAARRGARARAELLGVSVVLDGNHAAQPNAEGEERAMRGALRLAGLEAAHVGYVNAHGTSSPAGDRAECEAMRAVFRDEPRPRVNSTKALVGHTLYAAGVVELVATVLQMEQGFLHPNPNLDEPIDGQLKFVGKEAEAAAFDYALSNSFGFGGVNSTAVVARHKSD
jgi:malonyl-ACP decarboxylase